MLMQQTTKQQQAKTCKEQQGDKKLTSNIPRRGLLGPPTLRHTTLGLRLGFEVCRSKRRQEKKMEGLTVNGNLKQSKGREEMGRKMLYL